ncbi:MAG: efflux RND transporter periplasmic adaptor subunit [Planctomycetota bacterium]
MSSPGQNQAANATQTGIQVSLAGSAPTLIHQDTDSLTAALEEAVAALDEVHEGGPETVPVQQDLAPSLDLLAGMSLASSRREAAVCLTEAIAAKSGDCNIRCGIGSERLSRVYDARLGWLSHDSPVFRQIADDWITPRRRESDPPSDRASVKRPTIHRIEVHLPNRDGADRCCIWIDAKTDLSERLRWLEPVCETARVVLWSRPLTSWSALIGRYARKFWLAIVGVLIFVGILAVWPVQYRVNCSAVVETAAQRLVSTPFEAALLKTHVQPGDLVQEGEVLVELDGRPLRLEREAIAAELQQTAKEQDVALASGRIAEAQQAGLKKQKLEHRYELLNDRLNRLEVISPINGVIVSGDLEKYIGTVLERGQTLIEVAPMDRMVIEVEIPAHEIAYVKEGADARIKIDAIGGKSITDTIDNVYPAAELRDDQNVFVARIELDNPDQQLRPGMRGDAVTYGPLRPWVWSWVRGGIERTLWWIGY